MALAGATAGAEPVAVFPKATSFYLSTGNVVNWDKLKRKTNIGAADELRICIADAVQDWLATADRQQAQTELIVRCLKEDVNPVMDNRDALKFTLKLFLSPSVDAAEVKEAVEFALTQLGLNYAEILIVAFADNMDEKLKGEDVLQVWRVLEDLVSDGMLLSLGVSDMSKDQLESLCSFVQVKPSVNQISSTSCCAIPEDLKAFAAANDVQLLMHSDHKEMLPPADLQAVLCTNSHDKDGEGWVPTWVVRHSSLIKGRGVIKSKGYVLKAKRTIEFH